MAVFQYLAVMIFTGMAMVTDVRTRKIPNWLTVSGFLSGLMFHSFVQGLPGFQFSLLGFATGFGLLLILWIIGGGGGGDVKLMGAVGAWLGPTLTLIVFIATGFLAPFGQLVMKLRWQSAGTADAITSEKSQNVTSAFRKLPYAVPVAIVVWTVCSLKLMKYFFQ
ncbi:MAG: A24 family peptidase [Planctomycetaceae bacterium]